ncbi:hypothetical protein ACOMHN_024637 [Nucella lapillus]
MINFDSANMRMTNKKPVIKAPPEPLEEKHGTESDKEETDQAESGSAQNDPAEEDKIADPVNVVPLGQKEAKDGSCVALSMIQRFVSRLLIITNGKVSQMESEVPTELCLRLRLSYYQMEMLESFRRDFSGDKVFSVDEILIPAMKGAYVLSQDDPILQYLWVEEYFGVTLDKALQILMMILCGVVIALLLPKIRIYWCFVSLFVVSVGITWNRLYKKEVAKRQEALLREAPAGCGKMGEEETGFLVVVRNYLSAQFTFQQDACLEYHERILTDPANMVTPLEALAVTVVQTLVKPLHIVGAAISEFVRALVKDLPVQWQLITLAIVCTFLVLVLFVASRYRLRIPFFLAIEPSHDSRMDEVQTLKEKIQQLKASIKQRDTAALRQASPLPLTIPETVREADPPASVVAYSQVLSDRPAADDETFLKKKCSSQDESVRHISPGRQFRSVEPSVVPALVETRPIAVRLDVGSREVTTFCDDVPVSSTTSSFSLGVLDASLRDPETLGSMDKVGGSGDAADGIELSLLAKQPLGNC